MQDSGGVTEGNDCDRAVCCVLEPFRLTVERVPLTLPYRYDVMKPIEDDTAL